MIETTTSLAKIESSIKKGGLNLLVDIKPGQTRASQPRLELNGRRTVFLDDPTTIQRVDEGDREFLLKLLANTIELPGDFSADQLLQVPQFANAVFDQLNLDRTFNPNSFLKSLTTSGDGSIPVFYGSTSGINFAEVLETAVCAKTLSDRGLRTRVLFDFDGKKSAESQAIFMEGFNGLPDKLADGMLKFGGSDLMQARLAAVERLLSRIEGLPPIDFIDGKVIFLKLGPDFTLGQLLLLAKLAGNDPRLFTKKFASDSQASILTAKSFFSDRMRQFSEFSRPVAEMIAKGYVPAGFTYYARDARIGKFDGVVAMPLKMTEKANIYKILDSAGALFSSETNSGQILLPITRQRIQFGEFGEPVDPIALMLLAQDQPEAFSRLTQEFFASCRVLTSEEAIKQGTKDNKFLLENYFDLGGKNE